MRVNIGVFAFVLSSLPCAAAENRGISIVPDGEGRFEFVEDFATQTFLEQAFLTNLGAEQWQPGSISNSGPNSGRQLTYRFFGDRRITGFDVQVNQRANGRSLGGRNTLYLSLNGLDWKQVATSGSQEANQSGWQHQPVAVNAEEAPQFGGQGALWVRVVMDNSSGLPAANSNQVSRLLVRLSLGETLEESPDPQEKHRAAWDRLDEGITLDYRDHRGPHFYEDYDRWLHPPGADPTLATDETEGFLIQRTEAYDVRSPMALVAFVKTTDADGPLMARITVSATSTASRQMNVLWDGKLLGSFDTGCYFATDRAFYVQVAGPQKAGVHQLQIAPENSGTILVREIKLAGAGSPEWVAKPELPPGGSLQVLNAYYLPDAKPPADSQTVEGRHKKQEVGLVQQHLQRLYREHADFGALRILVRNNGRAPVRIGQPILLDGKPIRESYVHFKTSAWDARGVVWYRVRPRLLQPGQCGQIYVRFRRRPEGAGAAVTIPLENGDPVPVEVPYQAPAHLIDYVTTGESKDRLYVYVRCGAQRDPGRVVGLTLDGDPLEGAKIYGADFPGGVALAVAELRQPLEQSEYHVIGAETDIGGHVAAQFRVMPFVFLRGSTHTPAAMCSSMNMNWRVYRESLAGCEQHDLATTGPALGAHRRVAIIDGPDEPDAHDNRGGGYDRGLGYNARRLAHNGWQELAQRSAPWATTWLVINGTTRPLNWWVYGQMGDVCCFDPYPINYYTADHAYVRESLLVARQAGAPNRMFAYLEAFGYGSGQGVPKEARGPTPQEYRQNLVQAIGAGTKGLTSWVYVSGAGGWQLSEALKHEIAKCHMLVKQIESDLLLGTPINVASSDAGEVLTGIVGDARWPKDRVAVGGLLCGPDTLVLAAANHIPASKPDPPTIEPAKDVTITVRLPEFLPNVAAFEVTENGITPFACRVEGGRAVMKVDVIESGRVFVLRRRPGVSRE